MPLLFSTDHPTWTLKSQVSQATQKFLDHFGFNYFQYLRVYANGSASLLTNTTSLVEHFLQVENEPVVFSSFQEGHEELASYWFLWDEELPEGPVALAREKYNIRSGLTLLRRSKDYYDMIAVALPFDPANPGSFYLNKQKAIESFVVEFEKENKDLLQVMDRNPIVLPPAYRDENYQKICVPEGRFQVKTGQGLSYVTVQELACLRVWVQGYSQKEVGKILGLSPRTVETYLQRARERCGLSVREEWSGLL